MSEVYERYDYAWKQAGWSVQNPTMSNGVETYVDPGLPSNVSLTRVYGKFLDGATGRPLEGVFTVRSKQWRIHASTGSMIPPGVQKFRFRKGDLDVALPSTDDPDLTPAIRYEGSLTVAGYKREFKFSLPTNASGINVLDLVGEEGYIDLTPEFDEDGLVLGSKPQKLTVHLVGGGDFTPVIGLDQAWGEGATVALQFGNGETWGAEIEGTDAQFNIDKAISDLIPDGTAVSLVVTVGESDSVWAKGYVERHD